MARWKAYAPRSDIPATHHFYVSSLATWRVGYDVETLIKQMKAEGFPFNVWVVPGVKETPYRIEMFAPQVEGALWVAFYDNK